MDRDALLSRLSGQSVTRTDKARRGLSGDEMLRASLIRPSSDTLPPSYTSHDTQPARDTSSSRSSSQSVNRSAVTNSKSHKSSSVLRGSVKHGAGNELLRSSLLRMKDYTTKGEPELTLADFNSNAKAMDEELRSEQKRVSKAKPRKDTAGLFKQASSTDLLFLIDITYSMQPYIDAVKTQVVDILQAIERIFFHDTHVRMAVVTYADHGDVDHIRCLDFTDDIAQVREWVNNLTARGGKDLPEDVLGGLDKAIQASWQQQNRCLVHIADAPAHGSDLHDLGASYDDYYTPGSEPHGLVYRPLIKELGEMSINYAFLKITGHTDRMVSAFATCFGDGNAELLTSNKYYETARGLATHKRQAQVTNTAHFQEFPLGTDYATLQKFVVTSVISSFTRTASRLSVTATDKERASLAKATRSTRSGLSPWSFSDEPSSLPDSKAVQFDEGPAQWDTLEWFDKTAQAQGKCLADTVHNEDTLQQMMASDDSIKLDHVMINLMYHSKPFAAGAVRHAYYARAKVSENHYVVKKFQEEGHSSAEVLEEARIQTLCKAFALEFNGLLKNDIQLDFSFSSCLRTISASGQEWLSLEPFINGEYVKYNNNFGAVQDDTSTMGMLAQAFSHFTFERSYGHLMVVDLQGSENMLTDPAIHTKDPSRFELSSTNMSEDGMKSFFATHECNDICCQLGLKSTKIMFLEPPFRFRETWPVMSPVVCCSNKFCRRIVRQSTAQMSTEYPDYSWCAVCWPQLGKTKTSRQCKAPSIAPHHFEVSLFFRESQGQPVPSTCSTHREADPEDSSLDAIGAKLLGASLPSRTKSSRASIDAKHW